MEGSQAQKRRPGRPRKYPKPEIEAEQQVEQQDEKTPAPVGQMPIWKRRAAMLKRKGTTPRNLFEGTPFHIDMPDRIKPHVRFLWMSDIMNQKRPILPTFSFDVWQPVTQDVAKELGIENSLHTNDLTPEGVPKVGDAFLMWAPEEICKEADKIARSGADAVAAMRRQSDSFRQHAKGRYSEGIGDVTVTHDAEEIDEEEQRRITDVGKRF